LQRLVAARVREISAMAAVEPTAPPPFGRMNSGKALVTLEYWRILLSCLIIVCTNLGFMMIFSDTFGWGAVTYKALSFEFWITRAPLPRTRSALAAL
jgi:hypothetical protein